MALSLATQTLFSYQAPSARIKKKGSSGLQDYMALAIDITNGCGLSNKARR